MRFGLKLFLAYFTLLGLGIYFFLNSMLLEIKPGLRQSMETALIDTANLLAELVAPATPAQPVRLELLQPAVLKTLERPINATVWSHKQQHTELRIYITDPAGRVIYDSDNRDLGADYSRWNDVYLTLQGRYGARSTQEDPDNKFSTVMYIGAPIYSANPDTRTLMGVLTVGKPNISVEPFWQLARDNLRSKGLWLLVIAAIAGALLATWLSLNIHRLVDYAQRISRGEQTPTPRLNDPDLARLATAMEEMRTALDGKEYIEEYTLSLTHEMKSPLTALQGAAELIAVAQDTQMRNQLASNIKQQSERLRALVDQVLALARLENQHSLQHSEPLSLKSLITDECEQLSFRLQQQEVKLVQQFQPVAEMMGDRLLLAQALRNLLENALDFSPAGSEIHLQLDSNALGPRLTITDQGCGIPDYALPQIWQRFYSLPRPDTGQKSTGLGLSFVQQIAHLHNAEVHLSNQAEGGVRVEIQFHTENTHSAH